MPTKTLTPVDAFSEPVIAEIDGTVLTEAVLVDSALQRLTNQCTYLKNRLTEQTVRELDIPLLFDSSIFTDWTTLTALGSPLGISQTNAVGHFQLQLLVPTLPVTCTISEVHVLVDGAAHGGSYPPASFPSLALYRQDAGAATAPTLIASSTDAPASQSAYELPHSFSDTTIGEAVSHDSGFVYWLSLLGEDGANAVSGLRIARAWLVLAV